MIWYSAQTLRLLIVILKSFIPYLLNLLSSSWLHFGHLPYDSSENQNVDLKEERWKHCCIEVGLLHILCLKPESQMTTSKEKNIGSNLKLTTWTITTNVTNIQIRLLIKNIGSNLKLTTSTITTNVTNIQIRLLVEDIQQLRRKRKKNIKKELKKF